MCRCGPRVPPTGAVSAAWASLGEHGWPRCVSKRDRAHAGLRKGKERCRRALRNRGARARPEEGQGARVLHFRPPRDDVALAGHSQRGLREERLPAQAPPFASIALGHLRSEAKPHRRYLGQAPFRVAQPLALHVVFATTRARTCRNPPESAEPEPNLAGVGPDPGEILASGRTSPNLGLG